MTGMHLGREMGYFCGVGCRPEGVGVLTLVMVQSYRYLYIISFFGSPDLDAFVARRWNSVVFG